MADVSGSPVPRPPFAFRVGVAGDRDLAQEAMERLRPAVADILALIARETARLAADPRAEAVYAPGAPALGLLSRLAEGADRPVAEEASKTGYSLFALLPYQQAYYEKDFPQAETLELDGKGGACAEDSDREAGRFVVRNSDLLLVIWDGELGHEVGGTGEIVRFATQHGLPVWWIDAKSALPPRLIEYPRHLGRAGAPPTGDAAKSKLLQYLEQAIIPPVLPHAEQEGVVQSDAQASPLTDYLRERPLAPSFRWRAYAKMMDLIAPRPRRDMPTLASAGTEAEKWWDKFLHPADQFSIDYCDRYRSSYVWTALFAFVALTLAGAGAAFASDLPHEWEISFVVLELISLACILALVISNHRHRWHEKWISYRLLAELCRKQYVLSSIGRTLLGPEVFRMSFDAIETIRGAGATDGALLRDAWLAWYFSAAQRAAPFPRGSFATLKPRACALARSLADEQIAYHEVRKARSERASEFVTRWALRGFVLTLALVSLKFAAQFYEHRTIIVRSAAFGIFFSAAFSGALVGIRAYAEFSLLARQSAHMLRVLTEARAELDAIDVDEPLASRELGRALEGLAISMMEDVAGWAQFFRVKTLEAGR